MLGPEHESGCKKKKKHEKKIRELVRALDPNNIAMTFLLSAHEAASSQAQEQNNSRDANVTRQEVGSITEGATSEW